MHARFVPSFDGTRVAYYEFGSGPPLVLSTGIGVDYSGLWPQIEHFARSRRVIAWDYRGVGRSQPLARDADVSMEAHARDLEAVLGAAATSGADLLGWSMGVPVSLELYRREPGLVRSLSLCCGPASGVLDQLVGLAGLDLLAGPVLTRSAKVLHRPFGWALRWAERSPVLIPAATRLGVVAANVDRERWLVQVRSVADCDLHAYVRTAAAMTDADLSALLPRIDVPTLVIAAERDRVVPLGTMEALAADIAGAELVVVPGASHYCVIEQPDRINLSIARHLDAAERGS